MEKRQVLSADYGVVIERQLAAIHGVEQSHRDPELRHALLRKQFVAVIIDHPVRIDALDGNADMTIEIPAQIMDDLDEGRRGLAAWIILGNTRWRIDGTARHRGGSSSFRTDGGRAQSDRRRVGKECGGTGGSRW